MGGQAVRALAFHHCDPGSIPGSSEVISELSLFLMLFSLMPRRVFLRVLRFSSLTTKINNMERRVNKIGNVGVVSVREKSPQLVGHQRCHARTLETIKKVIYFLFYFK